MAMPVRPAADIFTKSPKNAASIKDRPVSTLNRTANRMAGRRQPATDSRAANPASTSAASPLTASRAATGPSGPSTTPGGAG